MLTGAWATKAKAKAMGVFYCTRESVKAALDASFTGRTDAQIDEAIDAASRAVEEDTNRVFYPQVGVRYVDWPDAQFGTSYRVWLEENEVISVSQLASGGVNILPGLYTLEPSYGPPYDHLELNLGSSASFGGGNTHQRSIAISGVFGYRDDETAAGQLAAAVVSAAAPTISVTNTTAIGIGSVLRIDDERMLVTGRAWADSGDSVQTDALTATNSNQTVLVTDGSTFQDGETVLIGAEQMLVQAVAGNALIVTRAWNGSTLAQHAVSAPIYRLSTLTVERGALGTVAATHADAAPVRQWQAPAQIRTLVRAIAIDTVMQEQSGYARTVGSGDNTRNASGAGLGALRSAVIDNFRRERLGVV